MVFGSVQEFCQEMFKTMIQATEHHALVLRPVIFVAVLLILWRIYRFNIVPLLRPDEPKELPYWIPLLGHLVEFFSNSHALLTRARIDFGNTREPFSLTILGMKTYVLTKAEDVSEVYRNTVTLSYEEFVQAMMRILGNSESTVQKMFNPLPKDKNGFPNPRGKPLGILFRDMHVHQVFPGENLTYLETQFHHFFESNLHLDEIRKMAYAVDGPKSVTVPLVQWCSDYLTKAGQDAYFGPKLAELDPELTDHFIVFDELSYQVIYQYPSFLAQKMLAARSRILTAFEKYLEIPSEQRSGDAWFVKASEFEMRELELSPKDMAIATLLIYWAINTNSRKAAFWLLAYLVQNPSLIAIVRKETAAAFRSDGTLDLEYLHHSVPQLDAMWAETLRLSAFSASVRFITADTIVGGKKLLQGNRLIMPCRQLHMNEAVFGEHTESFQHERFLNQPRLSKSINYRPFGGGITVCPGRYVAKRAVLMFITMLLHRFDIQLMPGQAMMEADLQKPVPGLMSPKMGQDMVVQLTPRSS